MENLGGGNMHLNRLLDHLKGVCGVPVQIDGQDAYRWEVPSMNGGSPTHLCLTLEQATKRASIWVFNIDRPQHAEVEFLRIETDQDLVMAIARINAICMTIAK